MPEIVHFETPGVAGSAEPLSALEVSPEDFSPAVDTVGTIGQLTLGILGNQPDGGRYKAGFHEPEELTDFTP